MFCRRASAGFTPITELTEEFLLAESIFYRFTHKKNGIETDTLLSTSLFHCLREICSLMAHSPKIFKFKMGLSLEDAERYILSLFWRVSFRFCFMTLVTNLLTIQSCKKWLLLKEPLQQTTTTMNRWDLLIHHSTNFDWKLNWCSIIADEIEFDASKPNSLNDCWRELKEKFKCFQGCYEILLSRSLTLVLS